MNGGGVVRLPFDILSQNYVRPKLFLCETDKKRICELETTNLSGSFKFNAYSELNFTVGRTHTNMTTGKTQINPFYNHIEALRLVYLEGFGYFEIQDPEIVSDGIKEVKNVTAYGLEYRLSQKYLEDFNINTGEADSLEVIEAAGSRVIPITLVNSINKNLSLTDLALEKVYDWTWGNIDDSLRTMSRQFEISRASVYDFIVKDICEKFNCYAVFDTIDNKINLYAEALVTKYIGDGENNIFIVSPAYEDVDTVTIDGYKTTQYSYYTETDKDTDKKIGYVTFHIPPKNGARIEITDGSQKKWQTDVYVTFDNLAQEVNVSYSAEDIKTVLTIKGQDDLDIREVNMGIPYIVDLSYYYTVDWMGQDLYDAYTKYLQTSSVSQSKYIENAKKMLEITGRITYETQRLSLQYSIADNVTSTTVGTYYVRGGTSPDYYYREVKLPDEYNANIEHYYMLSGSDLDEEKFSKLYAAIQTYFASEDDKDISEIEKLKDSFVFVETYTIENLIGDLSNATDLAQKDAAILSFFNEMWDQLGRTPLESLYLQPYKKIETTNTEAGWSDIANMNYWSYYPVTLVIKSLEDEIENRKGIIESFQKQYGELQSENNEISKNTSIYNNFTHEQLVRLSPFLREDEYTDDNFVETDSDTIDILMQTKQELLECGKIELAKLCEPKLSFSMDMANIYALKEFEPIIHQFQLGNLINVAIRDDYIKKARLLAVDINFDDFSDFSCEFGELTSLKTQSSIHADLLANAISAGNSVASSQSYWEKGADLATSTDLKIQNGLLGAIDGIYNDDKSVLIDNHGILLRKLEDNGEYSPYQIWLTNNNILVSTDSFDSAQTGIGVFEVDGRELYGVLAKAVLAGYIESSDIVGGTININDTFMVDQFGNVTMKASSIDGYVTSEELSSVENGLSSRITVTENGISTKVSKDSIISTINQSAESVAIDANKISLAGKTIDLTSDNITIDSTYFSVTKDGRITATSGEIAGWTIYDSVLRKETVVNDVTYQMYMQASDGISTTNAFAVRKKNPDASSWDVQFAVNYAGKMTAKNADITGTITAKDGSIAGYNIGPGGSYDNAIYKRVAGDGSGVDYEVGLKATSGDTDLAFYVKQSADDWASNSNVFYVRNNGQLYAQKADITGKINASSGKIGSWNVGDMDNYTDSIYSTYCAASAPSSSNPEYAVFMRGKGSSEKTIAIGVKKRTSSSTSWGDADETFYVRKDGYVSMTSGAINGNLEIGGSLTHTRGSYTVTMRGVQSDAGKGVFYITDNSSGSAEYPVRINGDGSAKFTNVTITGSSTIASACIPNLNADKITAGTLDVGRIPNISADKITSGTISASRLSSSVITTGNFSSKSLTTGSLTVTGGGKIGSWSVTSSGSLTAVSGDVGVGLSAYGLSAGSGGSTPWVNVLKAGQNASDQRLKKNILEFDNKFDNIFDSLRPVHFEYSKDYLGQGIHFGYVAQDVIKSFEDNGEKAEDYAFIYESAMEEDSVEKYYQFNQTEFMALNTWQIQKLKSRVEELENKLEALERNDTK